MFFGRTPRATRIHVVAQTLKIIYILTEAFNLVMAEMPLLLIDMGLPKISYPQNSVREYES